MSTASEFLTRDPTPRPVQSPVSTIRTSEPYNELAKALAKAQAEMACPAKNAKNPYIGNKYADFHSIREASKLPLAAAGIAIMQGTGNTPGGGITVSTRLTHGESGHWAETSLSMQAQKQVKDRGWVPSADPQTLASVITYARRYTISALLCLSTDDDDDGNAASGKEGHRSAGKVDRAPATQPEPSKGTEEATADQIVKTWSTRISKARNLNSLAKMGKAIKTANLTADIVAAIRPAYVARQQALTAPPAPQDDVAPWEKDDHRQPGEEG